MSVKPGDVFHGNRLVEEIPSRPGAIGRIRYGKWACACGNEFVASLGNIRSGGVKSCGCLKLRVLRERCVSHGQSRAGAATRLYRFWQSMKDRCLNAKASSYKHYGGRGVKVYKQWVGSFEAFKSWFEGQFGRGDIPFGASMDRIDNDGNYEPGNLRIADKIQQANNRRSVGLYLWKGRRRSLAEIGRLENIKRATLWARINIQKLTLEQAVEKQNRRHRDSKATASTESPHAGCAGNGLLSTRGLTETHALTRQTSTHLPNRTSSTARWLSLC